MRYVGGEGGFENGGQSPLGAPKKGGKTFEKNNFEEEIENGGECKKGLCSVSVRRGYVPLV
jgi:hypothetical protein